MRLSELIPLMQQCMKEHGDLPVGYEIDGCLVPARELVVDRAGMIDVIEDGTLVACIA